MYDGILIPTDGLPGTEGAVARALDLARACDATVHALSVVEGVADRPESDGDDLARARENLRERAHAATIEVQERAADLGIETVREVREGAPDRQILDYAADTGVDAVVMGVRGRTGPAWTHLGSTTERVVGRADVPVLTVPAEGYDAVPEAESAAYDRVLIPTDGSDDAERAADAALAIATHYGADVRVVYVVDTGTYGLADAPRSIVGLLKEGGHNAVEAIADAARERNLSVDTAILRGVPDEAILQYGDGADVDLIAMGTRGRADVDDHLIGSTTTRVVRRSGIPVLTVA